MTKCIVSAIDYRRAWEGKDDPPAAVVKKVAWNSVDRRMIKADRRKAGDRRSPSDKGRRRYADGSHDRRTRP